jgi:hypothetical protein
MAGSLLVSGNPQHYKAIGEGGQPVYSVAFQLREAIRLKAGAEVADCLAIPQPNQHGSVIDWYAPHPGDVVPWSTASVQEREDALAALDAAQGKLEAAAQAMRDTSGRNTQTEREKNTALRLITKAFYFPDPNFIFLVNGKPVITFWGFNTLGALLPSDPFGGLRHTAAVTETAATPTGKRAWWWWLLLLLLLLLLLFVLLRSCAPQSWLAGLPLSSQTVTEPNTVRPTPGDAAPKPPDTVIDRSVSGLRRWWSGQTGQSTTDTAATPVTTGTTGATTDTSGRVEGSATNTETPVSNAPETSGGSGEPAPLNTETPSNTSTDQTQTPTAGQSANNAAPPTTPPQTPPASDASQPGSMPGGGNPLQIPNSAANTGSTNFLDGRWNAGAGIQDAKTGKPLRMEYDFSQGNGQGKVNIQRGDGTRCVGDVAAQMQGRSLNINDRGVAKCSDGSTIALPKVTCVPTADGRADCQGRYENGSSFPVSMRHAPK